MKSLWCDETAAQYPSALEKRVYTSRLLGQEPALVLHGGGNTSVKDTVNNFFGEPEELLLVKGSGWDLATIEAPGFAPVKMDTLMKMAALEELSDEDMVKYQRAAMTDPSAPNPSVEAILHAIIPFKFVDHTHTDAVVTLTNTPDGEAKMKDLYGDRVFIIPYVMPGFALAKLVYQMTRDLDWSKLDGMVLMNHGLFTFANDAKTSYEKTIELVTEAEEYLAKQNAVVNIESQVQIDVNEDDLMALAKLRQKVSSVRNMATIANWNTSPVALQYSQTDNVADIATRGPLTPDHVIRTKRIPAILDNPADFDAAIDGYVSEYKAYFERNNQGETLLNPAPNFAIWKNKGAVSFGKAFKETKVTQDITEHTFESVMTAELMNGWQALPEAEIFEVEYWSLEQAKLKKTAAVAPLQGKIALVCDSDSDAGKAVITKLAKAGAAVATGTVLEAVREFGGLDILINADDVTIEQAKPFLAIGVNPCVIGTGLITTEGNVRSYQVTHNNAEAFATMAVELAGATFYGVSQQQLQIGE